MWKNSPNDSQRLPFKSFVEGGGEDTGGCHEVHDSLAKLTGCQGLHRRNTELMFFFNH